MTATLAGHVDQIARLLHGRAASSAGRFNHPLAEERELQELPAIQGQFDNLPMLDDIADLSGSRL
jgi:hypothetical protein